MNGTNMFDITLEFDQQVLEDLQLRALNKSASTNPWIKGPFSRIINQQVPPLEVRACWNKPRTEICTDDKSDLIELSAEVKGGARQVLTGHILTVDGEVSIKLPVVLDVDHNGRPYAHLASPKPPQLHMKKLKVTYEGSKWPEFLAKFDPTKEESVLRPVLTTQLMGPLASIPLTYMPSSLPVTMLLQSGESNGVLPITQAQAQLVKASHSVILGLMLDQARSAPSVYATLLYSRTKYNAALGLSTEGLNALLSYLCKEGRVTGSLVHSQWGPMSWQWESLAVTLHQDSLHLTGVLQQQRSKILVHTNVQSFLDKNGCLQSRLLSTNTDMATAETILASWSTLLKVLLRLRVPGKQDRDQRDRERLYQCFNLPGTPEAVEAAARALVIEDGRLILYYRLPKTLKSIPIELPPAKPIVVISQPRIPQQLAQGAPVTAQIEAKITKESSPPYDYVWTTDRSPEPGPEYGPKLAITKIPRQLVRRPGPQKLADVHLKVIDMFGQVTEVQGPAKYLPYSEQNVARPATQELGAFLPSSPLKEESKRNRDGLIDIAKGIREVVQKFNTKRSTEVSSGISSNKSQKENDEVEQNSLLLSNALGDEDRHVREAAAKALGKIGDATAIPLLSNALRDEDWHVREAAAKALSEISDPTAISLLSNALNDEDEDVRRAAVQALGKIGDATAIPLLSNALMDEDENVRQAAVQALDKIGDATAIPLLSNQTDHSQKSYYPEDGSNLNQSPHSQESHHRDDSFKDDASSRELEEKKYALVVGVNQSINMPKLLPPLKYAESDAAGISYLLRRESCNFAFPSGTLIGEAASTRRVREAIFHLIEDKSENDLLLFYFIGHSYLIEIDEEKFEVYLVTSDFDPHLASLDPYAYLSLSWIQKVLYERQKTASVICILDCCYAGNMVASLLSEMQLAQSLDTFARSIGNTEQSPASSHRTWAVLASTEKNASAYEHISDRGEGHASMTDLIIAILNGEIPDALDHDGNLTLLTLYSYLQNRLILDGQGPIMHGQFGSFPWVLAYHPWENRELRKHEDYPLSGPSSLKQPFDMSPSPATFADLDLEQVQTFLKRGRIQLQREYQAGLSEQAQMQALSLLQGEHSNYGALLCFGHKPQYEIVGAYTRCICWKDASRLSGWEEEVEYRGSLLQQFTWACDFLRKHLGIESNESCERLEIPLRVLEEALANALTHREYVIEPDHTVRAEGVQVNIFSDRAEITSPGGPPAELDGKSHPRNPQIMRIFYLAGYTERSGTGIVRMRYLMQKAGLPEPDIRADQQMFTITLFRPAKSSALPIQADGRTSVPESSSSHDEALARIEFVQRDLLELDVDALVDPVGIYLSAGSIGNQLIDRIGSELHQQFLNQEPLKFGEAFVTGAGSLATRYLIHTRTESSVGRHTTESIVKGAIAALHKAESLGDVRTIAFPALGSGGAGLDPVEIAPELLLAVTNYLKQGSQLERVIFAFINEAPYLAYIDAYRSLGGIVNGKEIHNAYRLFIETTPNPVTLGQRMHLRVELLPTQLPRDEDKGIVELSKEMAEVYCFVRANGLCILDTDVKSMPLNSRTGEIAPAHFELQTHLRGSRDYTIELFTREPNTDRTLIFQQTGQVTVESEMNRERLSVLPTLDIRVGTRPDFVLQIDSEQRSGECAPYELTYRLSSRLHHLQFQDRIVGQVVLYAEELNRMRTLLDQRLQLVGHLQPEDTQAQMHALGTYLFDQLFPSDSAAAFREVFWKAVDQITTWLIIETSEPWIPWELVAPYRADDDAFPFFLGERYQLSRWIAGYGIPLYSEVPLGATSLIHYQDPVSKPMQQNEEMQVWGQLLRAHSITQSVLKLEEAKGTDQDQEPVHEIHLLHYIDQLVSQRDLVLRNHSDSAVSPGQETFQARLDLRLRRPVVTLSILLRSGERTHRSLNADNDQLLLERVLPFLQAGASAVVGPWWPTSEEADQLFWPTFYHMLKQRVTLGEALWRARLTVKNTLPHLSDWLAYTLFGDPCARPYRPELSEGYTTLECLNPEEPLCPGKIYYFRASIRRHPPIWHHERLIRTEGFPQRPRALFLAPGLQAGIPEPMDMTPRGRDMLEAIVELRPQEAGSYLLTVRLFDGRERLQSLQLSLTVG